jgi:AAA domain
LEVTVYRAGELARGKMETVGDLKALTVLATNGRSWSPGVFKSNYRSNRNFLHADVLALDVDGGMSLAEAEAVLKRTGYEGAILPTKSHGIAKGTLKPCDRFRVVLVLTSRIESAAEHAATWGAARALFNGVADGAAKDPARLFYASTRTACLTQGRTFDVVRPVPVVSIASTPQHRKERDQAPGGRDEKYGRRALDGEIERVRLAGEGLRHVTLRDTAVKLGSLSAGTGHPTRAEAHDLLVPTSMENGYPESEAEKTFKDGWEFGSKQPRVPQERPTQLAPNRPEPPIELLWADEGRGAPIAAARERRTAAPQPAGREPGDDSEPPHPGETEGPDRQFNLFLGNATPLDPARLYKPASEEFVFRPFLAKRKAAGIHGPWGVGKTSVGVQLIAARACGLKQLWGHELLPGRSAFITFEDDRDDLERKLASVLSVFPELDAKLLAQNVVAVCLADEVAHLVQPALHGGGMTASERYADLEQFVREKLANEGVDLVVLETVSRMVSVENNDSVALLISLIGRLGRSIGAATLLSQHDTKMAQASGISDPLAARTGTFAANLRSTFSIGYLEEERAKRETQVCSKRFGFDVDAESLLVLRHNKGTSSTPRAKDTLLIRVPTEWGGVLLTPEEVAQRPNVAAGVGRRAEVAEAAGRARAETVLQKLVERCIDLERAGKGISENALRAFAGLGGLGPKAQLGALLVQALDARVLELSDKGGRGGGTLYRLTPQGRALGASNGTSGSGPGHDEGHSRRPNGREDERDFSP